MFYHHMLSQYNFIQLCVYYMCFVAIVVVDLQTYVCNYF